MTLGRLYPDTDTAVAMKAVEACPCPTDEEAKQILESVSGAKATVGGPISDMILQQLLAFVLTKLQEWLKK